MKKMMLLSLLLSYTASILLVSAGRPIQKLLMRAGFSEFNDPSRAVLQKYRPGREQRTWTLSFWPGCEVGEPSQAIRKRAHLKWPCHPDLLMGWSKSAEQINQSVTQLIDPSNIWVNTRTFQILGCVFTPVRKRTPQPTPYLWTGTPPRGCWPPRRISQCIDPGTWGLSWNGTDNVNGGSQRRYDSVKCIIRAL